ncbi:exodeoxyribonuclease VII small subunit [Kocuria palustris]|uniref:exodeoxyribonuclease VII small subunit n=1 Tax=Kocuria palustris TaxID=71999 RepID=UPI0011A76B65|nr:exodeoxyribonuclease VII small subunit [Kocuria palustris]
MSETAPSSPGAAPDLSDIESMGYEQAREELVATVTKLEAGGTALEESLALWERGEALANRCEQWLDGARDRLEAARARREDSEDAQD